MAQPYKVIMTSCGLTSGSLQAEFRRMRAAVPEDAVMWYIPTALIYEGCDERRARAMGAQVARQCGMSHVYLDPEHVTGDTLRAKLAEAGRIGAVCASRASPPRASCSTRLSWFSTCHSSFVRSHRRLWRRPLTRLCSSVVVVRAQTPRWETRTRCATTCVRRAATR